MWQRFYEKHGAKPGFALVGVAIDALPEGARDFTRQAGCTFPMALDSRNLLNAILGVKTVTNAILLDEEGRLRWQHLHGFRLARPEMHAMAERVVAGDLEEFVASPGVVQESLEVESLRAELAERPGDPDYLLMLGDALGREGRADEAIAAYRQVLAVRPANPTAHYAIGSLLLGAGRKDEAIAAWRNGLEADPMNFTLRKQIWMVQFPDRFYPEIDMRFQVEQIRKEGFPDLSKLPISIRRELADFVEDDAGSK
ncbi:MAG: tetratricopeptide repeat protein [Burkholderiales bacterium]|nr:tetratricopeptide repeat protein [Burkholderiales bacterium]